MKEVEYSILGPLAVRLGPDEPPLVLSPGRARLLARLLVSEGRRLPAATLQQEVSDDAPLLKDPRGTLQQTVHRLRDQLGDNPEPRHVVHEKPGLYALHADPLAIDAERFKLLANHGASARREHPRVARTMLEE